MGTFLSGNTFPNEFTLDQKAINHKFDLSMNLAVVIHPKSLHLRSQYNLYRFLDKRTQNTISGFQKVPQITSSPKYKKTNYMQSNINHKDRSKINTEQMRNNKIDDKDIERKPVPQPGT